MIIYGNFRTEGVKAGVCPTIDYMQFAFPDIPEEFEPDIMGQIGDPVLSCSWDESDWTINPDTGCGSFRAKGISLNNRYANGHLQAFTSAKLDTMQVYAGDNSEEIVFVLTGLSVYDDGNMLDIPGESLKPWYTEYVY